MTTETEKIYLSSLDMRIDKAVDKSIEKHVNGIGRKTQEMVDKVDKRLSEYIDSDNDFKKEFTASIDEMSKSIDKLVIFQTSAIPVVNWSTSWANLWKMVKKAGIGIAVIAGIVGGITLIVVAFIKIISLFSK